jgi:hypothetical protein
MKLGLDDYRASAERFIGDCLKIRDKDSAVVPFFRSEEFPAQRRFIQLVQEERDLGRPVRIVGLKPRQVGLTSVAGALIYHATALFPQVESRIVSDSLESAQAIHQRNEVFHQKSPLMWQPMLARSSRREILFDNPRRSKRRDRPGLGSRILAETAKNANLGRSHTINNFLGSEVAYWKDGLERALAIMNAVPEKPGTLVVLESTANGVGDYFHEMCLKAMKPGSAWRFFFFSWLEHPEYVREEDAEYNAEALDEEEEILRTVHGATPAQLTWRRYTIANKCGGLAEKFHQEYPTTPEEAFITSGRPAFNYAHLQIQRAKHLRVGRAIKLTLVGDNAQGPVIHAEANEKSNLIVYEPPKSGHLYVFGADPSKGLEEGDFQCGEGVDVLTQEQVCEWHGLQDPAVFADELFLAAAWYNLAILVVEKNGEGINVLSRLVARQYPRLYAEEEWDSEKNRVAHKRGWHQDEQKKHLILSELKNGINPVVGRLKIRSERLIHEMEIMRRDRLGKYGAPRGDHDDRVSGMALAYYVAHTEAVTLEQIERAPTFDTIYTREPLQRRLRRRKQEESGADAPYWTT